MSEPCRILFIDDDAYTRVLFSRLVADLGTEAHLADSISKAKQAVESHTYQMIFLDLMLNDGKGDSFIEWYTQNDYPQKCEIIITSGLLENNKPYIMNGKAYRVLPKQDLRISEIKKYIDHNIVS